MAVPSDAVLRAALRWLEHADSGVSRSRALFTTVHEYSDVSPWQYDEALSWLKATGLWQGRRIASPAEEIYSAAIRTSIWFEDADMLVTSTAEIPQDAERAAATLKLDVAYAASRIRAEWLKVDARARQEVGALGERLLVDALQRYGVGEVTHVSLSSDGYGYDILVQVGGLEIPLEVKATARPRRRRFYLSRHEFEVMTLRRDWTLVVVRISPERQSLAGVWTVPSQWISSNITYEILPYVAWESARVDPPAAAFTEGIPILGLDTQSWFLEAEMPAWR